MDSCQIFNFLFGARKATTELSKCFTANNTSRNSTSEKPPNGRNQQDKQYHRQPQSPLKQLKAKLVNFASSSSKVVTTSTNNPESDEGRYQHQRPTLEQPNGTYRATLVRSRDSISSIDDFNDPLNVIIPAEVNHQDYEQITEQSGTKVISNPIIDLLPKVSDAKENSRDENNNSLPNDDNQYQNNHGVKGKKYKHIVLYSDSNCEPIDEYDNVVARTEIYNLQSTTTEEQCNAKLRLIDTRTCEDHEPAKRNNDLSIDLEANKPKTESPQSATEKIQKTDKKGEKVKSLVRSFELVTQSSLNSDNEKIYTPTKNHGRFLSFDNDQPLHYPECASEKPITIVKPLPPKTPPKSNKAKYLNYQLNLNKPIKISQLFQDDSFLQILFHHIEPIDRCSAAQVCRLWRKLLYSRPDYWKDLVSVIDYTQLRREQIIECIMNTLQSAKLRQNRRNSIENKLQSEHCLLNAFDNYGFLNQKNTADLEFDQDEVWRVQELCNRLTRGTPTSRSLVTNCEAAAMVGVGHDCNSTFSHNQVITSKSSSIPSQISSTLSSVSLSSVLSPLSESSRIDSIKEKMYMSLDARGFEAICLYGATDEDIEDLVCKTSQKTHDNLMIARLNNCCLTDRGFELFVSTFQNLEEIEITGCNEITNALELGDLKKIKRFTMTDCINISDDVAHNLLKIFSQLEELTIQSYHLTDTFLEHIGVNCESHKLKSLSLPNCKEITDHSMQSIARYFPRISELSISGSTKICDDGIEILTERSRQLKSLDLSWCTKITDSALECIASDLAYNLNELILDRNIHITDVGLGYLATMSNLTHLSIRWCPRITDVGLESIVTLNSLRYLSLAGSQQITVRSLICLIDSESLEEVELTNCAAVNADLLELMSNKIPQCKFIY